MIPSCWIGAPGEITASLRDARVFGRQAGLTIELGLAYGEFESTQSDQTKKGPKAPRSSGMARPEGQTSNSLLDTLANWHVRLNRIRGPIGHQTL